MPSPLLFPVLFSGLLQAGEILISGMAPIVAIDGASVPYSQGHMGYFVAGLAAGDHLIEVRGLTGSTVASMMVTVPDDKRLLLQYRKKTLTMTGNVAASVAPPPPPPPAPETVVVQVAEPEAAVNVMADDTFSLQANMGGQGASVRTGAGGDSFQMSVSVSEGGGAPGSTAVSVGASGLATSPLGLSSASFAGVDPLVFSITLAGRKVPWVAEMGAFLVTDLTPGTYPFVLYLQGQQAMRADYTIAAGIHETCTILVSPAGYDTACTPAGKALSKGAVMGPAAGNAAIGVAAGGAAMGTTAGSATGGINISITTGGSAPVPPPVMVAPLPPQAPMVQPISEPSLQALVRAVEDASFSEDQVDVIRTAAANNHFTCAQVVRLLEPISFGDSQVQAVQAARPAILDPQNAHLIEAAFTFSSDKEKVRALFR